MQEVWQDKVNALIQSTNLPLPACHAVGIWENPLAIRAYSLADLTLTVN